MKLPRLAPLAAALALLSTLSACTSNTPAPSEALSEPLASSGSIVEATDWEKSVELDPEYGSTVTFSAENTGDVDLTISLNDTARTLAPGEEGRVSLDLPAHAEDCRFRARPTDSGKISLRYDLTQSD